MTDLRHMDFSRIRDEDLTAEQRKEIERRFQAFAGALARVKNPAPAATAPKKTIAKWAPRVYGAR